MTADTTGTFTTTGTIEVQRLHPDAVLPTRAHAGDAGLDLVSLERCVLPPGERAVVGTGVAVSIPSGWTGLICPRSGLAARHGIGVVNSPGVIDSGYRGEVKVVLHNSDAQNVFTVEPGDRIAQLVIVPALHAQVLEVDKLDTATSRASDGFGSTGGFANSSSEPGE